MRRISLWLGAILGLVGICGYSIHALGSPDDRRVTGSGVVKSETRPVSGFDAVTLDGVGKVVITQNGHEALTVRAEDNLLPLLQTRVVKGVLHLGTTPGVNLHPTKPIEFDIDAKKLAGLDISGAGNIQASQITSKELAVSVSGAGNVTVSGRVTNLRLTLSGTGKFAGADLQAQQATVDSSGVGKAVVNASQQLTVSVSGVGNVEYLGSPRVQQSISGVGRVTHRR